MARGCNRRTSFPDGASKGEEEVELLEERKKWVDTIEGLQCWLYYDVNVHLKYLVLRARIPDCAQRQLFTRCFYVVIPFETWMLDPNIRKKNFELTRKRYLILERSRLTSIRYIPHCPDREKSSTSSPGTGGRHHFR